LYLSSKIFAVATDNKATCKLANKLILSHRMLYRNCTI